MKKITVIILCLLFLIPISGCTEPDRPDYELLSQRMSKINEHYAFEYFDMFLYDNAYHIYFSLCSEDDLMLSLTIDDNGNIDSLTVTADKSKMTTEGERNAFKSFTVATINSFAELSDNEYSLLKKNLSYENTNFYFSDLYETYSSLRYNFIFSSNSQSINFYCEYNEVIENEELTISNQQSVANSETRKNLFFNQ